MKTIKEIISNEIIIKKSKFIGIIYPISTIDEVDNILRQLKLKHKNSTHICYSYIIDSKRKANDDGEPSGTAGIPILTVLERYDMNYILGVVIRYFGGIKLGAGGLIRAYSNTINDLLKQATLIEPILGITVTLITDYQYKKELEYLINKYQIINKQYNNQISYTIKIPITDWTNIKENHNLTNITYIEHEKVLID